MTEDGLTWKEQSEALCSALIENQSLSFLNPNEEGKTDAVSGVSISVSGFMNLAPAVSGAGSGHRNSRSSRRRDSRASERHTGRRSLRSHQIFHRCGHRNQ